MVYAKTKADGLTVFYHPKEQYLVGFIIAAFAIVFGFVAYGILQAQPDGLIVFIASAIGLIACAMGNMRYHADSELANCMFAGAVSVRASHRRRGLGNHVNAALLCDSRAAFGWTTVLEQAKADNFASVGMITKCGLTAVPDTVTIVVNLTGGFVSR